MNCDRAFERMTEPGTGLDWELEQHLERCPRCRQMRDTLSPVMEWLSYPFDAPVEETSGRSSSGSPLLTRDAVRLAEQLARDLRRPPRRMERSWWYKAATIAMIAVVGMASGVFLIDGKRPAEGLSPSGDDGLLAACLWTQPGLRTALPDNSARGVVVSCVTCHVPTTLE